MPCKCASYIIRLKCFQEKNMIPPYLLHCAGDNFPPEYSDNRTNYADMRLGYNVAYLSCFRLQHRGWQSSLLIVPARTFSTDSTTFNRPLVRRPQFAHLRWVIQHAISICARTNSRIYFWYGAQVMIFAMRLLRSILNWRYTYDFCEDRFPHGDDEKGTQKNELCDKWNRTSSWEMTIR